MSPLALTLLMKLIEAGPKVAGDVTDVIGRLNVDKGVLQEVADVVGGLLKVVGDSGLVTNVAVIGDATKTVADLTLPGDALAKLKTGLTDLVQIIEDITK